MKSNLTNEQLIDKVKAWVKKLCETGGSAWTLKVPVDLDNDPDVLIIELCNRFASQPPAPVGKMWEDSCPFCDISPVMCKSCGETLPSPVTSSLQGGYSLEQMEAAYQAGSNRSWGETFNEFHPEDQVEIKSPTFEQFIQSLNKK